MNCLRREAAQTTAIAPTTYDQDDRRGPLEDFRIGALAHLVSP